MSDREWFGATEELRATMLRLRTGQPFPDFRVPLYYLDQTYEFALRENPNDCIEEHPSRGCIGARHVYRYKAQPENWPTYCLCGYVEYVDQALHSWDRGR